MNELDTMVHELESTLKEKCPEHFEAINLYGQSRFIQGSLDATKEAMEVVNGGIRDGKDN